MTISCYWGCKWCLERVICPFVQVSEPQVEPRIEPYFVFRIYKLQKKKLQEYANHIFGLKHAISHYTMYHCPMLHLKGASRMWSFFYCLFVLFLILCFTHPVSYDLNSIPECLAHSCNFHEVQILYKPPLPHSSVTLCNMYFSLSLNAWMSLLSSSEIVHASGCRTPLT